MTIQHYVLFKLNDSVPSDEVARGMLPFVAKLSGIPGVLSATFSQNGFQRDGNFDLMLQVFLQDKSALETYIDHPIHKRFSAQIQPFIETKVKFDRVMG